MLLLLSPAKKQNFSEVSESLSQPTFIEQANELILLLKSKKKDEIQSLMSLSDRLAALNYDRYQCFSMSERAAAVRAFQGDVYQGLDVGSIDPACFAYLDDHVGILSGLYGFLRPFDAIGPHRLEMGTKLDNKKGPGLYAFWKALVTDYLNDRLAKDPCPVLINCASKEYSSVVDFPKIAYPCIHVDFKVDRGEGPKTIGVYAKKARGMMARWMVQNQLQTMNALKEFSLEGYTFSKKVSDEHHWVFIKTIDA